MSAQILVEGPSWKGYQVDGEIYTRSMKRVQDTNFMDYFQNATPGDKVSDYESTVIKEPTETSGLSDKQKIDQLISMLEEGEVIPDYNIGTGAGKTSDAKAESIRRAQIRNEAKLRLSELKAAGVPVPGSKPTRKKELPPLAKATTPKKTGCGIESRGKRKTSLKSMVDRFS